MMCFVEIAILIWETTFLGIFRHQGRAPAACLHSGVNISGGADLVINDTLVAFSSALQCDDF
jgi:hypothetical protein